MKQSCEVKGCTRARHGRRFCDTHYRRWIRGDDPHLVTLRGFHGHAGKSASSEYWSWSGMIQRCRNPKNPKYSDYGAREASRTGAWALRRPRSRGGQQSVLKVAV